MPWAIHLLRPGKPDAWHTGHRETEDVAEAKTYETRERAEAHRALVGLYKLCGWTATVKEVTGQEPNGESQVKDKAEEAAPQATEKLTVAERKKRSRLARAARRAAEAKPSEKAKPKTAAKKAAVKKKTAPAKKKSAR